MAAPALRIVKKSFIPELLHRRLRKQTTERELGLSLHCCGLVMAGPFRGNGRETVMRRVLMTALASAGIALSTTSAQAATFFYCGFDAPPGSSCVSDTDNVTLT